MSETTASNDLNARWKALTDRWNDKRAWKTIAGGEDGQSFGFYCGEYGVCVYQDRESGEWGWTLASEAVAIVDGSGGTWLRTLAEAKANAFDECARIILEAGA